MSRVQAYAFAGVECGHGEDGAACLRGILLGRQLLRPSYQNGGLQRPGMGKMCVPELCPRKATMVPFKLQLLC